MEAAERIEADEATPGTSISDPFPGLRSFTEAEGDFFFGRRGQTASLALRLRRNGFVAVVGPSGSGKSSLARSGLVYLLQTTMKAPLTVVTFTPRADPFRNFALALRKQLAALALVSGAAAVPSASDLEEILRQGQDGFIKIVRAHVPKGTRLLIIADQFEEMMRMARPASPDDADRFVAMLLYSVAKVREAAARAELEESEDAAALLAAIPEERLPADVSISLTMRSEYIGATALFRGLPELLTDHQFLTPRMNPNQLREAIIEPIKKAGKAIEPALVECLLNDVALLEARGTKGAFSETDSRSADSDLALRGGFDTLPVLQFALRQLWHRAGAAKTITCGHYHTLIQKMHDVVKRMAAASEKDGGEAQEAAQTEKKKEKAGAYPDEIRTLYVMKQAADIQQDSPLRIILSGFASSLYERASPPHQRIIRLSFMRLCGQGDGATLDVRRPTPASELAAVTDAPIAKVYTSLEPFTTKEAGFLKIGADRRDPIYDVSHESLIRQWHLLDVWVREESRLSRILRRLSDNAEFAERLGLASARDMSLLEDTHKVYRDGPVFGAWTRRYIPPADRERFEAYYRDSKAAEAKRTKRAEWTRLLAACAVVAIFVAIGFSYASYKDAQLQMLAVAKDTAITQVKADAAVEIKEIKDVNAELVQANLSITNEKGAAPDRAVVMPTPPAQEAAKDRLGFDLNEYASVSDWGKVNNRVGYVYIRATLPNSQDDRFVEHWDAADRAGLALGAFHVFNANVDGTAQADAFCDALKQTASLRDQPEGKLLRERDMPAMVYAWNLGSADPNTAIERFHACLMHIQKRTGKRPLIQTNPYFWIDNFEKRLVGKNLRYDAYNRLYYYPLALSHYTNDPAKVIVPKLWKDHGVTWALWHFTDKGELPTIKGRRDKKALVTLSRINEAKPVQWVFRSGVATSKGDVALTVRPTEQPLLRLLKQYEPQEFDEPLVPR